MSIVADIRGTVEENMSRVAQQGNWPSYINAKDSLLGRIPEVGQATAPGFDAGIACAMDIIPRDKQGLASVLHAAYTEAAVEQVRSETSGDSWDPDSESIWWLAMCSICQEDGVDNTSLIEQVESAKVLATDPESRIAAAKDMLERMKGDFTVIADGTPFVTRDGGMQGAYLQGHDFAVQWAEAYGIFFVGTFRESLGIPEDFEWS
ncbi:MAG: hypothetical protein ABIH21_00675 [Patescibacteria group bacterium]